MAAALLQRLRCWAGSSLARRFVLTGLALLLVIQGTGFVVIFSGLHRHASAALPQQLAMGRRSLQSLVGWRADKLVEGTRLLAADYGFRSAVLSHDGETIASALANHGARIGAAGVALLSVELATVAATGAADAAAAAAGPATQALAGAALLRHLSSEAARSGGAAAIAVVGGLPRQLVLVPMKAPLLAGWVLASFALPEAVEASVHELSATDLTLLVRDTPGERWRVAFSRLPPADAAALAARPWPREAGSDETESQQMQTVAVDHGELGVQALWFTPAVLAGGSGAIATATTPGIAVFPSAHAAPAAGPGPLPGTQPEVLALLSVTVAQALRPPRDLQLALWLTTLLGLLTFGLASAYTARRITTPLQSLATAAERLGSGDYTTPIRHAGAHDEVAELAQAFEQMRISVATKQAQIVQSEKLASIGQLAAGVAHEINNPIGFVFSNFGTLQTYLAQLFRMLAAYQQEEAALAGSPAAARLGRLREEIELDYLREDIPALMNESREGIARVRKIVQDLKDFSHVDAHADWVVVDLHAGLDSTLNIVNNEIKYRADVVKAYGTLPPVECLPSELNQVFMNLLVNASHAIVSGRGTITLRTGSEGGEAWVEVADDGCGIVPADLQRIFDPFFTTKAVGKGTGLGLSLSYGIVKKHGGRIEVASEPGRGSCFRVWLPLRRPGGEPPAA